jgi:uncharacterized cupin superfamily protein
VGLAHWDEVESYRRARGEMDGTWQRLGDAAGTRGVGLSRVRVEPGKLSTPPHGHGASEEVFFVLSGSGLAWQDGSVHEIRPRDCLVYRANELEHTLIAGDDGLEYLVFGTRHPVDAGWLPRSGAVRFGWPWTEGRIDDPWEVEAAGPPLSYGDPAPRPENILNVDEVEPESYGGVTSARSPPTSAPTRPGSTGSGSIRDAAARCLTAIPRRRRSSSSSRARGRCTCGRRRGRSGRRSARRSPSVPATSSRARRGRGSAMPFAPGRTA